MAINAKHPSYKDREAEWIIVDDCYEGQSAIKKKGTEYLPPTQAMIEDGMTSSSQLGYKNYQGYLMRAVFPNEVRDSVEAVVGLMHRKGPKTIELPKVLDPMRERATVDGEDLATLMRRTNEQQWAKGRLGLLLEVPTGKGPADSLPFFTVYEARTIINWAVSSSNQGVKKLELVVLDETGPKQKPDLEWEDAERYRVLATIGHLRRLGVWTENSLVSSGARGVTDATYVVAVADSKSRALASLEWTAPHIAGKPLDEIPFTFVNTLDTNPSPAKPPLLGLAEKCLTIYRGEADYRQHLFLQGQDTLVVIGGEEEVQDGPVTHAPGTKPQRLGTGAKIELPGGVQADAKFIGVNGQGLSEQRTALENDYKDAKAMGMRLLSAGDDQTVESGEALKVRVAARTASAVGVAKASAAALTQLLRLAARWMGTDESQVKLEPNIDFANNQMTGKELLDLQSAKNLGAPISDETIHDIMVARELTGRTYEEEIALIEAEEPRGSAKLANADPILPNDTGGGNGQV